MSTPTVPMSAYAALYGCTARERCNRLVEAADLIVARTLRLKHTESLVEAEALADLVMVYHRQVLQTMDSIRERLHGG